MTKEDDIAALFKQVSSAFGQADVLVNNAGVNGAPGPLVDVEAQTWWKDFEQNAFGLFLITRAFLKQVQDSTPSTIISLSTGAAYGVYPGMSAYGISKLVGLQLTTYVAAEHPNTAAIALHPGVVATDMVTPAFAKFAKDTPELVGGTVVYLCSERARWLSGSFVNANWDMEDLEKQSKDVLERGLLKITLKGEFGAHHFSGK